MVIKYTSSETCQTLEHALDEWDMAAAALLHRENLLRQLVNTKNVSLCSFQLEMRTAEEQMSSFSEQSTAILLKLSHWNTCFENMLVEDVKS